MQVKTAQNTLIPCPPGRFFLTLSASMYFVQVGTSHNLFQFVSQWSLFIYPFVGRWKHFCSIIGHLLWRVSLWMGLFQRECYLLNTRVTSWLRQDSDKQTGMVDDFEDFFKGKSWCSYEHLWDENFAYITCISLRTRLCWLSLEGENEVI